MAMTERRINKRIPAKFKINYIHKGDYVISFSKDISADGMFIYTKNPPPVSDFPKLTFSIGNFQEVSVASKVIWVNNDRSQKEHGMAVQFLDASDLLKKNIIQYVNRVAVLVQEKDRSPAIQPLSYQDTKTEREKSSAEKIVL